jgi:hypothetical protein
MKQLTIQIELDTIKHQLFAMLTTAMGTLETFAIDF